jgi:predicted ArsR family transcriptional regulator
MRLLGAVQQRPGRRAADLAAECEMPLNTVRDHLHVLEQEGLIRGVAVREGARGRPPVEYHPVHDAESNTAAADRVSGARERGAKLRAATGARTDPDAAAAAQIDVLYEHLDDAGLDPAVDEESLVFELAPCRYHDMIDDDQALVCAVHARLVGDVLRQVDGPLALKRLDPFVTEHRCLLTLARREAS